MARKIIAYIFLGLGFLIASVFGYYEGSIVTNASLYFSLGLLLLLSGFFLLAPKRKERRLQEALKKEIEVLKATGEKIKVTLSDCEIKSNDYSEDRLVSGNDPDNYFTTSEERINIITGNEIKNVEKADVFQSVLIFSHNYMGRTEKFISKIVTNEHTSLLFKLDKQKTTYIYVDRQDRTKYYFDLEFLEL